MDKLLNILKLTRDLISDPRCWTRNVSARDANGEITHPLESEARSFCLNGALCRAVDYSTKNDETTDTAEIYRAAVRALSAEIYDGSPYTISEYQHRKSISVFNDTHSHAKVIDLLDSAIERLS